MLYSNLPIDVIYHILLYTGIVKFRNGKYMNQIPKTDVRYKIIDTIPRYRLYDFYNTYGLFVWLKKIRDNHPIFINITIDYENKIIEYCYHNLLHSEINARNVKYFYLI
jgi:hypothetical protein